MSEVVIEIGASGYRTEVSAGRHGFVVDEPESLGGTDTGPTPYDLLLAALGSCTAITIQMYADRKGWPLEGATVRLRHERVHAKDCADCENSEGFITEVWRDITLRGPLDAEQRARLLEIADRCPVHRTLEGEVKVRTTAVEPVEAVMTA
jgi:putative redox protein